MPLTKLENTYYGTSKVGPAHAKEAYGGSGGTAPLTPNLSSWMETRDQLQVPAALYPPPLPPEKLPTEYDAAWARHFREQDNVMPPPGIELIPRLSSPQQSHYTDWDILACD